MMRGKSRRIARRTAGSGTMPHRHAAAFSTELRPRVKITYTISWNPIAPAEQKPE
jgi:hypothetical protein